MSGFTLFCLICCNNTIRNTGEIKNATVEADIFVIMPNPSDDARSRMFFIVGA